MKTLQDKPDFEKLAKDSFEEERPSNMAMWTAKENDEEVVYWRKTFKKGCEKIWNEYVVPASSRTESLQKEVQSLKEFEKNIIPLYEEACEKRNGLQKEIDTITLAKEVAEETRAHLEKALLGGVYSDQRKQIESLQKEIEQLRHSVQFEQEEVTRRSEAYRLKCVELEELNKTIEKLAEQLSFLNKKSTTL